LNCSTVKVIDVFDKFAGSTTPSSHPVLQLPTASSKLMFGSACAAAAMSWMLSPAFGMKSWLMLQAQMASPTGSESQSAKSLVAVAQLAEAPTPTRPRKVLQVVPSKLQTALQLLMPLLESK